MLVGLNTVVRTSNLMIYSFHIHQYIIRFINNLFQVHEHYMLAVYDISYKKNATSVNISRWVWKQFYSGYIEVSSFSSLTTKCKLKCAIILLHFPRSPHHKWGIYHIVGPAVLFSTLICPRSVLPAIASQLPSRHHLSICSRHDFFFSTGKGWWSVGDEFSWYNQNQCQFLSSKLYAIWTYFLTNPRNTLTKVFLVTMCRKMTIMGTPHYMILYRTRTEYKSEGSTLIQVYYLQ
jgi:hypothetical protein